MRQGISGCGHALRGLWRESSEDNFGNSRRKQTHVESHSACNATLARNRGGLFPWRGASQNSSSCVCHSKPCQGFPFCRQAVPWYARNSTALRGACLKSRLAAPFPRSCMSLDCPNKIKAQVAKRVHARLMLEAEDRGATHKCLNPGLPPVAPFARHRRKGVGGF